MYIMINLCNVVLRIELQVVFHFARFSLFISLQNLKFNFSHYICTRMCV